MRTSLLQIPTKKSDDVKWYKALNAYLLSIYGSTLDFEADLTAFNKLRLDLRGAHADKTGLSLYFKYYSQLELLDLRVPVDQVNRHRKISFTWYDAFLPTVSHQQHALPFEKASILFNLASLMSKYAVLEYRESHKGTEESFKTALTLLQQAAGVLQFVLDNFLHAPSNDLAPGTVKFLVAVCLAQAQEIFTLKVITGDTDQKKNAIIARLCASTATHYEKCLSVCSHLLTAEGLAGVSDLLTFEIVDTNVDDEFLGESNEYDPDAQGIPDSKVSAALDAYWVAAIQLKSLFYMSLAHYFQGLNLEATSKYGQAIAYLTKSQELIEKVPLAAVKTLTHSGESVYDLLDDYKYHKDALAIKLAESNKDNDLIYNEVVPSVVTLPAIKPMDSAKITSLGSIPQFALVNEWNYENFLKNVVPMNIHELLSYYSEEKSQLLRNELDAVDVLNEELSSALEYYNLPKSLVNINDILRSDSQLQDGASATVGPDVIQKVNDISAKYHEDRENERRIGELRKAIYARVMECDTRLSSLYGQSPQIKEDIIRIKKSLYDAANSDSQIFDLISAENRQLYAILGKGTSSAEFKGLFAPNSQKKSSNFDEPSLLDIDDSQFKNASLDKQIEHLEDLLHDLSVNRSSKTKLVEKLKEEIHKDDISDILMLNSKIKSTNEIKTVIFPEELRKFDGFSRQLDEFNSKQNSLLAKLKTDWQVLASNPMVVEIQNSTTFRTELLYQQTSRISALYQNWTKYSSGLSRGVDFYNRLLRFAENLERAIASPTNASASSLENSMERLRVSDAPHNTNRQVYRPIPGSSGAAPGFPPRSNTENNELSTPGNAFAPPRAETKKSSGLIYDEPSAYKPDMYDFFQKQG